MAMPIALSQLGYVVVQFADNAMVGTYGGDDPLPLSAVSFGVMMSFVMFSLAMGITLGLTPVIGEHFARGEYRRTAHYLQSSLVSYPILGVIFMVLQQLSVPLLYRLGQPVDVVDMAVPYYRLMGYSLPAIMLYGCFKQFMEGVRTGQSSELMHITGGYHYHTVRAESEAVLDRIEAALNERNYIVPEI